MDCNAKNEPPLQLPKGILAKVKVSEIIHVITFDIICIYSFDTLHIVPWKQPKAWWWIHVHYISTSHTMIFLIILGTTLVEVKANQYGSLNPTPCSFHNYQKNHCVWCWVATHRNPLLSFNGFFNFNILS